MTSPATGTLGRSSAVPQYRKLLALSAILGLVASVVAWSLLTLVPLIQDAVFTTLPAQLGYESAPWW